MNTLDLTIVVFIEFGIYVDNHGVPHESGVVEWEGLIERVALHFPYLVLFDSRFIETRDLETGRLCQIVHGNNIRCILDGRWLGATTTGLDVSEGPGIHFVADDDADRGAGDGLVFQRVVELRWK